MHCQNCQHENPIEALFCMKCGTKLIDDNTVSTSGLSTKQTKIETTEGERRQLTVMFCDLVGSTELSEQLDPEELRDVMKNYQEVCAKVITRYDGHIAKYLGDGILVYFGYPLAHEDDAQRAVRAGLEFVRAIRELRLQDKQLQKTIQVRIGIHTGLVVVGEMGAGDVTERMAIVGEAPNIAARLQDQAQPNTVVISSGTHGLIQGYFTCKSHGFHKLKGVSQTMESYQVIEETGVQSRFEVAATKGLTPLVGREQEIEILSERWERVKDGEGQVVLLSGEAGIGKTRLVQLLKESLEGDSHVRIESRCSPYHQNSYLYPVIDHFHRLLEYTREDSPREKLGKLEQALGKYGFSHEDMVPIFATLLSLPIPDRYPPHNLSPQRLKQKTYEALLAWLLKEADQNPVLRIVEDLQWVDASTLEYLGLLVKQVPTARVLTLITFRSDFNPPWAMRSHVTQITLNRLTDNQIQMMINSISGGKTLPSDVVQNVVNKTDGIPLFIEELTKMVVESGLLEEREDRYDLKVPLPPLAIPTTLKDSLMARLDRLVSVKEMAQLVSTLGREFTYDLLRAVSPFDEEVLHKELGRLVEAEILYQRGLPPHSRYYFKHALIQEAAYESLLKSKRRMYHQKIAEVLEQLFPETVNSQPEIIAHHLSQANLLENATDYWLKAGQMAIERSAHIEAINHLRRGLDLLKSLPDAPGRLNKELTFHISLGAPLRVTRGFAAPEVERVYKRARDLCQKIGDTPQLFSVLRGLGGYYLACAQFKKANEIGDEYLQLAKSLEDPSLLLHANYLIGSSLFCLGEINQALYYIEQAYGFYNPQLHSSDASLYGQDPGPACLFWLSFSLWYLGYPDQGLSKAYEALKLAKNISHPYSIAVALNNVAFIHQFRREGHGVYECSKDSVTLSTEGGVWIYLADGNYFKGMGTC